MAEGLRVDRWLWFARFFKTRSMASRVCASHTIRVNGAIAAKPNHVIRPGDVLTFPAGRDIRVVRVQALGSRRGPAPEAQALYQDLAPPTAGVGPTARRWVNAANTPTLRRVAGAPAPVIPHGDDQPNSIAVRVFGQPRRARPRPQ